MYAPSIEQQQSDAFDAWIETLKGFSDEDMGHIVAQAAVVRHGCTEKGFDLLDPPKALEKDQQIIAILINNTRQHHEDGNQIFALALSVWVHTLMAYTQDSLRPKANIMWSELSRGFPHVNKAADEGEAATGERMNTDGYDQFPDGIDPSNNGHNNAQDQ